MHTFFSGGLVNININKIKYAIDLNIFDFLLKFNFHYYIILTKYNMNKQI